MSKEIHLRKLVFHELGHVAIGFEICSELETIEIMRVGSGAQTCLPPNLIRRDFYQLDLLNLTIAGAIGEALLDNELTKTSERQATRSLVNQVYKHGLQTPMFLSTTVQDDMEMLHDFFEEFGFDPLISLPVAVEQTTPRVHQLISSLGETGVNQLIQALNEEDRCLVSRPRVVR